MADPVTGVKVTIPRPMAPSVISDQNLQNVSFYKSLRGILTQLQTSPIPPIGPASVSLGSVATTAPDGTPATFNQGQIDSVLIRVAGAGNAATIGIPNEWVAGGGETQVAHTLNRVPIGYWVVRNKLGAMIYDGDSAWDTTYIYFHTDHSDSDIILMIF